MIARRLALALALLCGVWTARADQTTAPAPFQIITNLTDAVSTYQYGWRPYVNATFSGTSSAGLTGFEFITTTAGAGNPSGEIGGMEVDLDPGTAGATTYAHPFESVLSMTSGNVTTAVQDLQQVNVYAGTLGEWDGFKDQISISGGAAISQIKWLNWVGAQSGALPNSRWWFYNGSDSLIKLQTAGPIQMSQGNVAPVVGSNGGQLGGGVRYLTGVLPTAAQNTTAVSLASNSYLTLWYNNCGKCTLSTVNIYVQTSLNGQTCTTNLWSVYQGWVTGNALWSSNAVFSLTISTGVYSVNLATLLTTAPTMPDYGLYGFLTTCSSATVVLRTQTDAGAQSVLGSSAVNTSSGTPYTSNVTWTPTSTITQTGFSTGLSATSTYDQIAVSVTPQ